MSKATSKIPYLSVKCLTCQCIFEEKNNCHQCEEILKGRKKRSCLKCGKMFMSRNIGNRRCPHCEGLKYNRIQSYDEEDEE